MCAGSPRMSCRRWLSTIARLSTTHCFGCAPKSNTLTWPPRLLGPTFTLRQLHGVYEAIAGESLDLANFRRKMLSSGDLEDTGEKVREGRQRPAAVSRYVPQLPAHTGTPHEFDGSGIAAMAKRNERKDVLAALSPSAQI